MDLQIKIFNEGKERLLDEGEEIRKVIEKLGWRWYGSGYSFCDNSRDLTFGRRSEKTNEQQKQAQ